MATEKLFRKDVYLKECDSKVVEVIQEESPGGSLTLILDQTNFFPTGGGQPCDTGDIDGFPVIDVYEKEDVIYHKVTAKPSSPASDPAKHFKAGDTVRCVLDWGKRFDHMQRHCGEHILTGMFFQELGGVNRGFHMGEAYMTIDIDLKEISWEEAMRAERLANEAVWANLPVTTRYFDSREEAESLPLRKPLAIDEAIIIVCVGSESNPADCVACCGTHPSTSGQVGLIKILKLEKYKGMTRIYFKAGKEAFLDYQNKSDIMAKLNTKYSSEDGDLLEKIRIQDEKNKAIRQELYLLKTALIADYAAALRLDLKEAAGQGKDAPAKNTVSVVTKRYVNLKGDDLLQLGRQVTEDIKGLLILECPQENSLFLFSQGTPHCGNLVKENVGIYNGKGGGNATGARALFTKEEYLELFVDLLRKHLR